MKNIPIFNLRTIKKGEIAANLAFSIFQKSNYLAKLTDLVSRITVIFT